MNNLNRNQLLQLTYIRMLVLVMISATLVVSIELFNIALQLHSLVLTLMVLLAVCVLGYLRLGWKVPITRIEWFAYLVADTLLYATLLFQVGGANNPFVFLLLIPLIVTATTLPWHYTLSSACTVSLLYTGLLYFHIPLLQLASTHRHELVAYLDLHSTGLWLNFVLTVIIVAIFVIRMRLDIQRREQQLVELREKQIRDQQLLSIATLAAGTAHELGTPLTTMQILLSDLLTDIDKVTEPDALKADLCLLQKQVLLCSDRLRQLKQRASADNPAAQSATSVMQQVLKDWQLMRPHVTFSMQNDNFASPLIMASPTLQQALLNLLNNAADACPDDIHITLNHTDTDVVLTIADQGPGIDKATLQELGETFVSTKNGLGIGIFLSNAILASQDGQIRLYNRPEGGTLTEVKLPIVKTNDE